MRCVVAIVLNFFLSSQYLVTGSSNGSLGKQEGEDSVSKVTQVEHTSPVASENPQAQEQERPSFSPKTILRADYEPEPEEKLESEADFGSEPTTVDKRPIWERSVDEITNLAQNEKIELTRNMTAEQWNTILQKWHGTDGVFNADFVYYTTFLPDQRRVQLMEEAFENDLEYLFRGMALELYVPRSSAVKSVLEKGIKKYPDMRGEILWTMYTVGLFPNAWHFNSSEQDLELVKDLVKHFSIKDSPPANHSPDVKDSAPAKDDVGSLAKHHVIDHLVEVVEADLDLNSYLGLHLYLDLKFDSYLKSVSEGLVKILFNAGILKHDDFCVPDTYHKACAVGSTKYLKLAKGLCPTLVPDTKCVDSAVENGHNSIIDFVEKSLGRFIIPSKIAVYGAASRGHVKILELLDKKGIRPDKHGIRSAVIKGRIEVLEWLYTKGISLENDDAFWAVCANNLKLLEWLDERGISPDKHGANLAAAKGFIKVLNWLAAKGVLPSRRGATDAAINGHIEVLNWLAAKGVLPSQRGATDAAINGHIEVLKWLSSKGITPDNNCANDVAGNGHVEVLKWLYGNGISANTTGANRAAQNGHIEVLKWLHKKGITPDNNCANDVAWNGHVEVLKWLDTKGISASTTGASWAARTGHAEVVNFLSHLTTPILPDQDAVDLAAQNDHVEVIRCLSQLTRPILPTQRAVDLAPRNGHVVKYLSQLATPMLPTQQGATGAAQDK